MEKNKSLKNDLSIIFTKNQRRELVWVTILMLGTSVLETITVSLMYPFMYMLMGTDDGTESTIMVKIRQFLHLEEGSNSIAFFAVLLAIIYVIKGIYTYFSNYVQCNWVAKTKIDLSVKVFDKVLNKPYSFHLQAGSAIIQYTVIQNIDRFFNLVAAAMMLVSDSLTGGLIVVYLLIASPSITIIAMIVLTCVLAIFGLNMKKKIKLYGEIYRTQHIDMMKWVLQAVGGLKGIYVNRKQKYFVNNYTESVEKCFNSFRDYSVLAAVPKIITENISMAALFTAVGLLALRGTNFLPLFPLLGTFAMAALKLIPICNHVNSSLYGITYNRNALDEISRMLSDRDIESNSIGISKLVESGDAHLQTGVDVDSIAFKYNDASELLFKDLSFHIPAGKSVAFIGTTGAGKTTLADIILGLHRISAGKILVDGHDIEKEKEWWASKIGYIPQYIYLCDDTIKSNVAFGVPEDEIDEEAVWDCLDKAQLKEYVISLPLGIHTITGENGIRLSGGQRQRLGIARALYGNPPFIVLDEATSSLDYETESAIIEAINCLVGEKTLLIIAHRLSTIKNCDYIYRVEGGQLYVVDNRSL